ncbi:MAG: glucose-1-phosphate cytidylyltransferase [Phycisphaerae bacterium]|nr:glucose-1-phosphate cytidylyltransferase [Phycisphaerae bacterium]
MKVVLFCGGFGTRLRDYSEAIPKPMVPVGYRPILWHVMKYYAHFGHKDFILCLGYRADAIKQYFLNYDECLSNDFTLSQGGRQVDLANSDIGDWRITFVDTGTQANIGQRLMAVRSYLEGEEAFLANYADNVTDLPLPKLIEFYNAHRPVGLFMAVRPTQSFHVVKTEDNGRVCSIVDVDHSDMWINGGYFVLSSEIFNHMEKGDELVIQPFQRLIAQGRLMAYKHDGFWACMDTFKDKQQLDEMYARGEAAWEVWKRAR